MVWKVIHNIGIKLIYLWLKGKERWKQKGWVSSHLLSNLLKMRAEAILGKKDAIPENDSSDPCHILIPLRAGTALPMLRQLIANKLPTRSIKLLWYRFPITLSMPGTTLSPLPTTHIITADFAVKVNTEVSDQEEGGKGAGHLIVLLVLNYYMVAVPLPCFYSDPRLCGQAMPFVTSAFKAWSNWASVLGAVYEHQS